MALLITTDVPIDPAILASPSPTPDPGPTPYLQRYASYTHGDTEHHYQGQPNTRMDPQEWWNWTTPYPAHKYLPHPSPPPRPIPPVPSALPEIRQHPPTGDRALSTTYSFVAYSCKRPKRPRRSYKHMERMYKCGWNGCEKAYSTLNHLNTHVGIQSHGAKRYPKEFKDIREEYKAKRKASIGTQGTGDDQV